MRIAIFGGSFNPPHIGHISAVKAGIRTLQPDKLLVIPASDPPHKSIPEGSPDGYGRLHMLELALNGVDEAEVSDIELKRGGVSYTAYTVSQLRETYPDAEFFLLIGIDMLKTFEGWVDFHKLLLNVTVAAFTRRNGEDDELFLNAERLRDKYGANIVFVEKTPIEISSTELRNMLKLRKGREMMPEPEYAFIIKHRYYGAKPELAWLREKARTYMDEKRIRHAEGCEQEAMRLAERWGADPSDAAEAAILHDITKKLSADEQLKLCEKYDIMIDNAEIEAPKILHSMTGAALARAEFGVSGEVYEAIYRHTTGGENMTTLSKVVFLADYIEPGRSFEGLSELRRLAYEDINAAMKLGLRMTIQEIEQDGKPVHTATIRALEWFNSN